MNKHKLLIVANNPLSQHDSNGRSLLNMLADFSPENLSQINISAEKAASELCANSLSVRNSDVLQSFFGKSTGVNKPEQQSQGKTGRLNKTAFTMLSRDIVWDSSPILKKIILPWAHRQNPDAVLLQLGDSALLINIAVRISKELGIPLITYNTEDYYFKSYDYMKRTENAGIVYRAFHNRFRKAFRRMMELRPVCVYNCEGLNRLYGKEFGMPGHVIYNSSSFCADDCEKGQKIVYAGNLGLGRHVSLIEIGKALQSISPALSLDVYGSGNEEAVLALSSAPGIRFRGFVPYETVHEEIKRAKLLIHTESFEPFTAMDTRYAFSGKLADYAASGVPMLIYAPLEGEGAAYFNNAGAAFVAENSETLQSALNDAIFNEAKRETVINNAGQIAAGNHNLLKNSKEFSEIVEKIVSKG